MDNYTQFKLANGDEIIAEIVDEPEGSDTNIVIRKAMQIYSVESSSGGYRYYGFKPWMIFQLKKDYLQLLNYTHIVGEAKPDALLLDEYVKALKNEVMTEEEKQEQMEEYYGELKARLDSLIHSEEDSAEPSNVVSMFRPNKDKMH